MKYVLFVYRDPSDEYDHETASRHDSMNHALIALQNQVPVAKSRKDNPLQYGGAVSFDHFGIAQLSGTVEANQEPWASAFDNPTRIHSWIIKRDDIAREGESARRMEGNRPAHIVNA